MYRYIKNTFLTLFNFDFQGITSILFLLLEFIRNLLSYLCLPITKSKPLQKNSRTVNILSMLLLFLNCSLHTSLM